MNLKEEIAKSVEAIKTASVEKSTKKVLGKFGSMYAQIVAKKTTPKQRAKQLENTNKICAQLEGFLAEWEREKSNRPFFDRLMKAGLLEGNVWKGTLRQAGVAAYLFSLAFKDEGNPGKNSKQYDKYYQAEAQFSKFDGIKRETLRKYVYYFGDYVDGGLEGAARFGQHEDEIEVVINALK